jgi:hypothetical protein
MNEVQEKLLLLLKDAEQKNFKLQKLSVLKKYERHLNVCWKLKCLIAVAISWLIYARFSHLLDTKKVATIFLSISLK